jgi:hypothetical protein
MPQTFTNNTHNNGFKGPQLQSRLQHHGFLCRRDTATTALSIFDCHRNIKNCNSSPYQNRYLNIVLIL